MACVAFAESAREMMDPGMAGQRRCYSCHSTGSQRHAAYDRELLYGPCETVPPEQIGNSL
jgi:hypothetical protein